MIYQYLSGVTETFRQEHIAKLINNTFQNYNYLYDTFVRPVIGDKFVTNWHFMKEDERYAFLIKHLPEAEYREYYDIFADFRFGGYKLLPDIITETRNYNISANASAMQYPNDSEELTLMVKAYLRNPVGNYRETVSKEAARIIETHVISFNASVKYIVALGKRDFLYDAYYRHINRFAKKGE